MNKNDFTFYEKHGKIFSMGFEFNNMLKTNNLPAMIGGGSNSKMDNIGVPISLALLNTEPRTSDIKQVGGSVIDNNLFNKLLHLAEQRKSTNSKTKKNFKKRRNKTRKNR